MSERVQRAYQSVNENGTLSIRVYKQEKGEDGKQEVAKMLTYDCGVETLPAKQVAIMLCKGVGSYMSTAYGAIDSDDVTVDAIEEACDFVYKAVLDGTFTPGRAGELRPTPLIEALAEHLGQPVHVVQQAIKDNPKQYTPTVLARMAKEPAIASLIAKIEERRAKERAARAREAAKDTSREALDIKGLFNLPPSAEGAQAAA